MELVTVLVAAAGYVAAGWLLERHENQPANRAKRSITTARREGDAGRRSMDQRSREYVQDVKNIVRRK